MRKVVQDSSLIMKLNIAQGLTIFNGTGLWCPSLSFYRQLAIKACIKQLDVRETVAAVQKVLKRKLPTDNLPPTQWGQNCAKKIAKIVQKSVEKVANGQSTANTMGPKLGKKNCKKCAKKC